MLKRILLIASLLAFIALTSIGLVKLYDPAAFPIKKVIIETEVDPAVHQVQLAKLIKPLSKCSFFAVDIKGLKAALQSLSWVSTVGIRRLWPNQIIISVASQRPVGFWNKSYLLNNFGEVFTADFSAEELKKLPKFVGPNDLRIVVLDTFQRINRIVSPLGLTVDHVSVNASQDWLILLNDGLTLELGQHDILVKLKRFVKVYNKIISSHAGKAKHVDLRYEHGMAVRW